MHIMTALINLCMCKAEKAKEFAPLSVIPGDKGCRMGRIAKELKQRRKKQSIPESNPQQPQHNTTAQPVQLTQTMNDSGAPMLP